MLENDYNASRKSTGTEWDIEDPVSTVRRKHCPSFTGEDTCPGPAHPDFKLAEFGIGFYGVRL